MKNNLIHRIKKNISKYLFLLRQRTNKDGVTYMWKRHGSKDLIIVFSGIGLSSFNYVKTLKHCPQDQLFIKDCWADGISYYWYEKGFNHPEKYTQSLIHQIVNGGGYEHIYTIGSSKGGTAALYFGLLNNVDVIYAGACQYYVGSYLGIDKIVNQPEQWENFMGDKASKSRVEFIDKKIHDLIRNRNNTKTLIKLLYSTEEHTYPDHIKPLIADLDAYGIVHEDEILDFPKHSMVGVFFKESIKKYFSS